MWSRANEYFSIGRWQIYSLASPVISTFLARHGQTNNKYYGCNHCFRSRPSSFLPLPFFHSFFLLITGKQSSFVREIMVRRKLYYIPRNLIELRYQIILTCFLITWKTFLEINRRCWWRHSLSFRKQKTNLFKNYLNTIVIGNTVNIHFIEFSFNVTSSNF